MTEKTLCMILMWGSAEVKRVAVKNFDFEYVLRVMDADQSIRAVTRQDAKASPETMKTYDMVFRPWKDPVEVGNTIFREYIFSGVRQK